MIKIETLLPLVCSTTREEFVKEHSHPYLVLYLDDFDTTSNKQEWSFKTDTISSWHNDVEHMTTGDGVTLSKRASRYRVYGMVKATDSPWADRISVGRARNNDIVLPHKSVSKLHAHFSTGDDGGIVLSDAGSRNGTRINSHRLLDGAPVPTSPGDLLTFGAVALTHFDPGGLYDLVRQLIAGSPSTSP